LWHLPVLAKPCWHANYPTMPSPVYNLDSTDNDPATFFSTPRSAAIKLDKRGETRARNHR
jgi:hypothetical protein